MTKEEFNSLEILDQVEYINRELQNNNSITSVCKELDIGRSTIRDRFKKHKYMYIKGLNKYVCNVEYEGKKNTNNNKYNTDVIQKSCITDIMIKSDEEVKANLLDIVNNYEILKEIIELHKCRTSVIKEQITIDLEEAESKLTTLRVNANVLKKFNNFCTKNKQYKKVDLLSQALKEFIEKYN